MERRPLQDLHVNVEYNNRKSLGTLNLNSPVHKFSFDKPPTRDSLVKFNKQTALLKLTVQVQQSHIWKMKIRFAFTMLQLNNRNHRLNISSKLVITPKKRRIDENDRLPPTADNYFPIPSPSQTKHFFDGAPCTPPKSALKSNNIKLFDTSQSPHKSESAEAASQPPRSSHPPPHPPAINVARSIDTLSERYGYLAERLRHVEEAFCALGVSERGKSQQNFPNKSEANSKVKSVTSDKQYTEESSPQTDNESSPDMKPMNKEGGEYHKPIQKNKTRVQASSNKEQEQTDNLNLSPSSTHSFLSTSFVDTTPKIDTITFHNSLLEARADAMKLLLRDIDKYSEISPIAVALQKVKNNSSLLPLGEQGVGPSKVPLSNLSSLQSQMDLWRGKYAEKKNEMKGTGGNSSQCIPVHNFDSE